MQTKHGVVGRGGERGWEDKINEEREGCMQKIPRGPASWTRGELRLGFSFAGAPQAKPSRLGSVWVPRRIFLTNPAKIGIVGARLGKFSYAGV